MLRMAQAIAAIYLVVALGASATMLVGAVMRGAVPLIPRDPVVVSLAYGTEKEAWLQAAAAAFAATNPQVNGSPIEIQLQGIGSRDMVTRVAQGELQPTVISPASNVQIELLRSEWQARVGGEIFFSDADAPQPLVITPLVLVAWQERAEAMDLASSPQLWQDVHDLLANPQGWAEFGQPDWGLAKFGHTNPESSNSGIQTLLLLAYGFHNSTRGLETADILDANFQAWLGDIERAVLEFPSSTGTLMQDMVRFGPSKFDMVVVYENLAIENIEAAQGRWAPISIYYPPANILSDHPYAILNAEWVTDDQRAAAAQFRDFLLTDEMQTRALVDYGFRPASATVPFDVADSPFMRFADYGVQVDIAQSVEIPPGDVLNELIVWWGRQDYE